MGYFKEPWPQEEFSLRARLLRASRMWTEHVIVEIHLQAMVDQIPILVPLPTSISLSRPPWPKSYTLGVHYPEKHTLETITQIAENIIIRMGQVFFSARILTSP